MCELCESLWGVFALAVGAGVVVGYAVVGDLVLELGFAGWACAPGVYGVEAVGLLEGCVDGL